ncbi:MAG TPA: hypothetical protein HPQ00_08230, partial [Magnetococcales bacterium]|nr:hypothetical protein [Magnetococcales bacterium]
PWELLLPPDGLPWGRDCNRCIRRRGGDPGQPVRFSHDLQHPPLQTVIHVATQHEDAHALRVAFQTMAKSITAPLSISVEPTGSFNGWVREVKHWQPHLVILQGTTMVRSGRGFFLFADEEGQADPKTGDEIMEQVLENTRVGCLIVCGRDLDHPPPWSATALLADDLARGGIPLTVAWPDRVHEGPGFVFLAAFLDALAHGATIDAALHRGGDLMARQANPNRQISWSIPMIFQ